MDKIQRGQRYLVIDDFLPLPALRAIREHASRIQYQRVDSVVDAEIDGAALRSRGGLLNPHSRLPPEGPGEALNRVMEAVLDHPEIYGQASEAWSMMSSAFWRYNAGTRIGWHNDAGNGRSGEFILYLHEEWRPSWGGELIVLDEPNPIRPEGMSPKVRYAAIEDAVARSSAVLTAIRPQPNRLVMMQSGTCHYINRVDLAAGDAIRSSLTGFTSLPSRSLEESKRLSQLGAILGWDPASETSRSFARDGEASVAVSEQE